MQRLDAALARLAATQHSLISKAQARDVGLSDSAISRLCSAGVLIAEHRGVFRHAAGGYSSDVRLAGAVLACGPSALASHRSAAVLHGLDGIRRWRPEVTVLGTTRPKVRDVMIHRTDLLDEPDRTLVHGIPTTAIARTLLDLGSVLPFPIVDQALQVAIIDGRVTVPALVATLERVGKRGRRGTASLRAVLRNALPDAKSASLLEHRLLQLIERAGLPRPTLQHELRCADGRQVRLDTAWPERRLAIEAHGHRWHATRAALERDLARARAIRASGWTYDAFGWSDVHDRAEATEAAIVDLYSGSVSPALRSADGRRQRTGG